MPLSQLVRLIARVVIGLYFLVFGGDKILGREFTAPGHLADWATTQIAEGHAFSFFRPFLEQVVIPNGRILSWVFAVAEFGLGLSLLSGLLLGPVALLGAIQVACIGFASGAPRSGAGLSEALAGTLTFVPLILLLLVISAENGAGPFRGGPRGGGRSKKKEKD